MARRKTGTRTKEDDGSRPALLKSVRRALQLLEYLARHPGRATDAAEGLGLPWATLHRTLSELEQGGFLQRDPDSNRYSIGPRLWYIGTGYLANHPVLEAAQPYLEIAAESVEFTVQLVERLGDLSVTLYSQHRTGEAITKATYGHHFPLHCGSKGQVLLAYAEPRFVESYLARDLERLTPETITEPEVLRARLDEIRAKGFARTEGDVQAFTGSLSAPIFNRKGEVVAAVCYIARRSALRHAAREEEVLESLLGTAQSISIALGWRPGDTLGREA